LLGSHRKTARAAQLVLIELLSLSVCLLPKLPGEERESSCHTNRHGSESEGLRTTPPPLRGEIVLINLHRAMNFRPFLRAPHFLLAFSHYRGSLGQKLNFHRRSQFLFSLPALGNLDNNFKQKVAILSAKFCSVK